MRNGLIGNQTMNNSSGWVTRGHFLTSASKLSVEPNGGILTSALKKRPPVTQHENTLCWVRARGLWNQTQSTRSLRGRAAESRTMGTSRFP